MLWLCGTQSAEPKALQSPLQAFHLASFLPRTDGRPGPLSGELLSARLPKIHKVVSYETASLKEAFKYKKHDPRQPLNDLYLSSLKA